MSDPEAIGADAANSDPLALDINEREAEDTIDGVSAAVPSLPPLDVAPQASPLLSGRSSQSPPISTSSTTNSADEAPLSFSSSEQSITGDSPTVELEAPLLLTPTISNTTPSGAEHSTSHTRSSPPAPHTVAVSTQQPQPQQPLRSIPLTRSGSDPGRFRTRAAARSHSPRPSSPGPMAGPSSIRPRQPRYADPDQHWLSEDEGEQFSRDVGRQRRTPRRPGSSRGHRRGGDGSGKDTDPEKNPALLVGTEPHSRTGINNKPSTLPMTSTLGSDYQKLIPNFASIVPSLLKALSCPVCKMLMTDPATLQCGHSLCLHCSVSDPAPLIVHHATVSIDQASDRAASPLDRPQQAKSLLADVTCPDRMCRKVTKAKGTIRNGISVDFVLQKISSLVSEQLERQQVYASEEGIVQIEDIYGNVGEQNSSATTSPDETPKHEEDNKRSMGTRRKDPSLPKRMRGSVDLHDRALSPGTSSFVSDVLSELECQVCVTLIYEPMTTPCGHTFCKRCLHRSLDHSNRCPLCRAELPKFNYFLAAPVNYTISRLIITTFPLMYDERRESEEKDQAETGLDTPIFVCMVSFPMMPTNLHIYEPRYRLMMRRAMDSNKRFGMVLPSRQSGGFNPYGTMLEIRNIHVLEDGRSLVEAVGVHRFKVLESGTLDGYTMGRTERIEDIPDEEEAELESAALARGRAQAQAQAQTRSEALASTPPAPQQPENGATLPAVAPAAPQPQPASVQQPQQPALDSAESETSELSNEQLVKICRDFVEALRNGSTPWLIQRLNDSVPPMPEDAREFTWWMAMLMPIDDHEKAKLLQITSYRLRLRLIVFWIQQMQHSWWFSRGCTIA